MKIAVLGAGGFGTSLACNFAKTENQIYLWGRSLDHFTIERENEKYLPGVKLPSSIVLESSLENLSECDHFAIVTPAQKLREILAQLKPINSKPSLILCSKGLETETGLLQSDIAREVFSEAKVSVLSGPSFASEIGIGLPTAITLAADTLHDAQDLQKTLSNEALRLYGTDDLVGVQLGGALKNVIAIGAGMVDGAGFGESARAAFITRGYSELSNLAMSLGAKRETLVGLSGLGDLILTCNSDKSRNFRFGQSFAAKGTHRPNETVEGIATAKVAFALAQKAGINAPLIQTISDVLSLKLDMKQALGAMMARPLKTES